jgi:hypothetical protein
MAFLLSIEQIIYYLSLGRVDLFDFRQRERERKKERERKERIRLQWSNLKGEQSDNRLEFEYEQKMSKECWKVKKELYWKLVCAFIYYYYHAAYSLILILIEKTAAIVKAAAAAAKNRKHMLWYIEFINMYTIYKNDEYIYLKIKIKLQLLAHTQREKKSHKHSIHEFCAACIRVEI